MQTKCVVLSGIVVLLAASGAWAAIGQVQGFQIGAVNALWGPGIGSAEGSHQVMIGQEQGTITSHFGGAGIQKETGVFVQTAATSGPRSGSIQQIAQVRGTQGQLAGGWPQPASAQGQQMGVGFTTTIHLPCGSGAATGTQSFVGGQTHTVLTPTSMSTESQVLGATQYTAVVGGPHGSPTVSNSLNVQLSQGQLAGISCLAPWDP